SGPYLNGGKNTIDVIGKTPGNNHVIQWGGGFSIGNKAQVNFIGNDQNYLNIAHGTSKSTIAGILEAGNNNVFLINPNGVIITKTGTINANRFVASTSSMSDEDIQKFTKMQKFDNGLTFSPVFKPQKAGNVVNMGNINANNVLLIGNKVGIDGGHINGKHNDNVSGDALENPSGNTANKIHLVGNEVYIDKDMANFKIASGKVDITANTIYTQRQMINFANDKYIFGNNANINVINYTDSSGKTHIGSSNFKKALTMGNMGDEKKNAIEWWHFAKGWNERLGDTRSVDEFRLVGNIDFNGNKGQGIEGKDWQNYANYCIERLGCTNMIVAFDDPYTGFNKIFDGQNHSLKNINMDFTLATGGSHVYAGLFGNSRGATFKNIHIDYMGGGIKVDTQSPGEAHVGGFIGAIEAGSTDNIILENVNSIEHVHSKYEGFNTTGGFAGSIAYANISNVTVRNIKSIKSILVSDIEATFHTGGFVGFVAGIDAKKAEFNNIKLENIENISNEGIITNTHVGGFMGGILGDAYLSNIALNNIYNIINNVTIGSSSSVGGFVGGFYGHIDFENIALNNIYNIDNKMDSLSSYTGGFVGIGHLYMSSLKNIYMFFNQNTKIKGREVGILFGSPEESIPFFNLSNIHIYHHENDLGNATADQDYWGNTDDKIQIHTYNNSTQESAYKDFLSRANTIKKPNHSDVSLEQDDLNKEIITQIIEDITKKGYVVDIAMLEKLLEIYSKFNQNTAEGEKIAFIQTYFNIKDENEARGILQSLDFLTYYTKNETFNKNKISNEAKSLFDFLQAQSKITLDNNEALFSYLKENKDKLIAEYNEYKRLEQIFKDKEQNYFKAEAEFNRLLDLVNKGLLKYNDPKFTQAFDNWLNAYNAYNALSNDISELNNNVASISNGVKDLGYTNFSFAKFDDITNIDIKEPEIPNIDNSQGGDLPDFEQTASLNLIGNETLNEEEEQEEVDETSLLQKSKTCIVSDNYKTMNPCVAGM
ncbi:filamentous hemagglutinin N-terminal domain-containing protein, partial [Campylobacter lari]|nr:filamentous hemagglutinin N-terminal domain-containing protein [Campylobacter lari]MCV3420805.1 filamentous hemagglutinin N-terminal domain-containing protein [Campylobacter lari]